ncbi:hypothetical protein [Thermoactinospora rubra]|uniref:hypothetical protein n=1 Tax=Thermoactinospora rubra TaxID=1088767 RepID=UPI000A112936|nr:hypothetical protein [Thermoactinospora rubra]
MAFGEEAVRRALPKARQRRSRGVRLRTMAPLGSLVPDVNPEDIAALDGEHRRLAAPPTELDIVDRRTTLPALDPADPEGDYLEVHSPVPVAGLPALFEHSWASAAASLSDTPATSSAQDGTPDGHRPPERRGHGLAPPCHPQHRLEAARRHLKGF